MHRSDADDMPRRQPRFYGVSRVRAPARWHTTTTLQDTTVSRIWRIPSVWRVLKGGPRGGPKSVDRRARERQRGGSKFGARFSKKAVIASRTSADVNRSPKIIAS